MRIFHPRQGYRRLSRRLRPRETGIQLAIVRSRPFYETWNEQFVSRRFVDTVTLGPTRRHPLYSHVHLSPIPRRDVWPVGGIPVCVRYFYKPFIFSRSGTLLYPSWIETKDLNLNLDVHDKSSNKTVYKLPNQQKFESPTLSTVLSLQDRTTFVRGPRTPKSWPVWRRPVILKSTGTTLPQDPVTDPLQSPRVHVPISSVAPQCHLSDQPGYRSIDVQVHGRDGSR